MHEISTEIDIEAGASLVWAVLTDFASYPAWNPMIRNVRGELRPGGAIVVSERLSSGSLGVRPSAVTVSACTLREVREPRRLEWGGGWPVRGLYGVERRFRIDALPSGGVRLIHSERHAGALLPLFWKRLLRERQPAFESMNTALKRRVERGALLGAPAAA